MHAELAFFQICVYYRKLHYYVSRKGVAERRGALGRVFHVYLSFHGYVFEFCRIGSVLGHVVMIRCNIEQDIAHGVFTTCRSDCRIYLSRGGDYLSAWCLLLTEEIDALG